MKTFVSFARYGLIRLPKKSKDAAAPIKKASIFDSDSDEVGPSCRTISRYVVW